MGEEKLDLGFLASIPQYFFDLIGRVVPGALGILAALLLSGNASTWESWLQRAMGQTVASSAIASTALFLISAYIVGQILSIFAKYVERIGGALKKKSEIEKESKNNNYYDWLRMYKPEAGAQCAKIRGEFTMHNGLAVVLLFSAIAYALRSYQTLVVLGLIVLAIFSGIRGRLTEETFHETAVKFIKAARSSGTPPGTLPPPPKPAPPVEGESAKGAVAGQGGQ
jgi:hypothetical protein